MAITGKREPCSNRCDNVGLNIYSPSLVTILQSSHAPANRDCHIVPLRNDRRLNPLVPEYSGTYTVDKEKKRPYRPYARNYSSKRYRTRERRKPVYGSQGHKDDSLFKSIFFYRRLDLGQNQRRNHRCR